MTREHRELEIGYHFADAIHFLFDGCFMMSARRDADGIFLFLMMYQSAHRLAANSATSRHARHRPAISLFTRDAYHHKNTAFHSDSMRDDFDIGCVSLLPTSHAGQRAGAEKPSTGPHAQHELTARRGRRALSVIFGATIAAV